MKPHRPTRPSMSQKSGPLSGKLRIPGDKSISHRSIILGGLAAGETKIEDLLESNDIMHTCEAMKAMGAIIHKEGSQWRISGVGNGCLLEPRHPFYFGNSGTGASLIMGLAGVYNMKTSFTGDKSLSQRSMSTILNALQQMGTQIVSVSRNGSMPFTLKGPRRSSPISFETQAPSAQVKSAILLAGLNTPGRTTITEAAMTRDHTERMLKAFGAEIEISPLSNGKRSISIKGEGILRGKRISIPGDPSSAAFPMVAALIIPDSDIILENVLINPSRTGLILTLQEMGADIQLKNCRNLGWEQIADLHVRASSLKGINVPSERAPSMIDEYPALAIASCFAQGKTTMRGLEAIRLKESDRLTALSSGLKANGIMCETTESSLSVQGKPEGIGIGGGVVKTHMDHRIAMSFLVMGLSSEKPVTIDDTSMISTSFPEFIPFMQSLGGKITEGLKPYGE